MLPCSASARALSLSCLFALAIRATLGATVDEWRSRTIYQVMTDRFSPPSGTLFTTGGCKTALGPYCGGTWSGIMQNLDYIQGMNFDAIWISPIVAQLPQLTEDGRSYAGYWQQNLYDINYQYGSPEDLQALIAAVHERGMLFMMDVVTNHMAYHGAANNVQYSVLNPFDDAKYYHSYCEMDYSGKNVTSLEECWLGSWFVPLADLRTEDQVVRDMFGTWITQMVANYSVDGLRIDAGANVEPSFFTSFVESAGVFATAEVYLTNDTEACQWEKTAGSILNYPVYWPMTTSFQPGGDFTDLVAMMDSQKTSCNDVTALGTFSENQDVPRFANHTSDLSAAKNVATFVIMSDGIPIIYQGQEQHFTGGTKPFTNREPLWETGLDVFAPLYQHIATLNTLRQHVVQISPKYTTSQSTVIYQDPSTMVMRKGPNGSQMITVFSNAGENGTSTSIAMSGGEHGYINGTQLTEILSCNTYTVNATGWLNVPMSGGLPRVMWPTQLLSDSSLCGTGGLKFNKAIQQTSSTATTYTTTVSGTPTATVVAATLPVVTSAAVTISAAKPTSSGAAMRVGFDVKSSLVAAAVALAFSSGVVGTLIGSILRN